MFSRYSSANKDRLRAPNGQGRGHVERMGRVAEHGGAR